MNVVEFVAPSGGLPTRFGASSTGTPSRMRVAACSGARKRWSAEEQLSAAARRAARSVAPINSTWRSVTGGSGVTGEIPTATGR